MASEHKNLNAFNSLLAEQNGKCPICYAILRNHESGARLDVSPFFGFVGVLCTDCYQIVTLAQRLPSRLRAAIDYLNAKDQPDPPPAPSSTTAPSLTVVVLPTQKVE